MLSDSICYCNFTALFQVRPSMRFLSKSHVKQLRSNYSRLLFFLCSKQFLNSSCPVVEYCENSSRTVSHVDGVPCVALGQISTTACVSCEGGPADCKNRALLQFFVPVFIQQQHQLFGKQLLYNTMNFFAYINIVF